MTHLQKAPRKPLLNEEQGEIFISALDDVLEKQIAKHIFVDGMTNEDVATTVGYSTRQIERIRISLMKTVLKRIIEKQIPKKVTFHKSHYRCPSCNDIVVGGSFCKYCGQAILWGDTE